MWDRLEWAPISYPQNHPLVIRMLLDVMSIYRTEVGFVIIHAMADH